MEERIALLSVKKYGDEYLFNVGDKTVKDMLEVVENDNAKLADFSALGKRIDLVDYVTIQQSDKFTQSVEADLDGYEKKAEIYTVNNGKGGIAEGDRDDFNSNITYYTYDAEIKGLIWKDYGDGSMNAEYYGEHVCSVDRSTNEYNIGSKGWDVIDTGAPDDDPANYRKGTRDYVKTLPKYKEMNPEISENRNIQMSSYDIDSDIQGKAERQADVLEEAVNSFENSVPEKPESNTYSDVSKEDIKMDEQNVNNNEILEELKALRGQIGGLEQTIVELKERAEASEQKLDAITAFIAASNEAQSFEKTMHITEKVTEQITGCDKAEFFALDADKRFFTTNGDTREYQSADSKTNALLRSVESKELSIEGIETAYIPVVSKENKAIGVIVAEKKGGFEGVDFTQFDHNKAIMSQIDLAVKKELIHQENITDKLTGLKNEKGLAEFVNADPQKKVTVMEITAQLPKENTGEYIKAIAKEVQSKGRSNINDNVYSLGGGKFISVMSCDEKKAKSVSDLLDMSVKGISFNIKAMTAGEITGDNKQPDKSEKAEEKGEEKPETEKADRYSYYNAAEYNKMENKVFVYTSTKTARAISDAASEAGITCSVKYDKEQHKATVTFDGKDKDFVIKKAQPMATAAKAAEQAAQSADKTSQEAEKSKEPKIFNKEAYSKMSDRCTVYGTVKEVSEMSKLAAAENVVYSAMYNGNKSGFTVDRATDPIFAQKIETMAKAEKGISAEKRIGEITNWADKTLLKAQEKTQETNRTSQGHDAK